MVGYMAFPLPLFIFSFIGIREKGVKLTKLMGLAVGLVAINASHPVAANMVTLSTSTWVRR